MDNKNLKFISHNEAAANRKLKREAQAQTKELGDKKQADIDYLAIMEGVELPSWEEEEDE